MTIYEQMKLVTSDISHHESDLYVLATPETCKIVDSYEFNGNVRTFRSEGKLYFDIPFAFDPFWDKLQK